MSTFFTSEILLLPKALNSKESLETIKNLVKKHLEQKPEFRAEQNVIFFNKEYANFPIEEVRNIQAEAQYSTSFSGTGKRAFVLCNFDSASIEAQNAALKIVEESPKDTLILLLVSQKEKLLETIASRCLTVSLDNLTDNNYLENNSPEESEEINWPNNYAQAITLSEKYKDRKQAQDLISNLLNLDTKSVQQKQILLQAYQDLNRNQNVQLVLENCFFNLVDLEN